MLSLREMERAVAALSGGHLGARLERVSMPAPDELVLELGGGPSEERLRLLLSCRPGFARLSALGAGRKALPKPPALAQYLKAHVQGARLRDVRLRGGDRQASLVFEGREGRFELLLSILGPRSNVYLLDERGHLVVAARPLADTRRDLRAGEPFTDPEGRPPAGGTDRFEHTTGQTPDAVLAGIEVAYAGAEAEAVEDDLRRRLRKALRKALGAVERKAGRLRQDAEAGANAEVLEQLGELLKGCLDRVAPKATEVVATDFESGEPVTILLDPKKSAAQNLEDYFRRARKAMRKREKAQLELGALDVRREELVALEAELAAAASEEELRALAERPDVERIAGRFTPPRTDGGPGAPPKKVWKIGKRELPTRLVPKRYATESGLEVWVGKNDEGNDVLSTRLARGRDLFFHLEGNPGSHVILRVEGKDDPPQSAILDAAELSVHYSKARSATRASVHVAAIRDVSKPRGAKPGLVYVHRGRTIQLRRSPERLRRVLEARIDD